MIGALGPGGAERVMSGLASWLATRHEVTLLTYDAPGAEPFYPLDPRVQLIQTGLLGGIGRHRLWRVMIRFAVIRRHVKQAHPDVVLSFMETMNVTAVLSCLGTKVPVVISERSDPKHHDVGRLKSLMRRLIYPVATVCVVQTDKVAAYFASWPRPRLRLIPNPIPSSANPARTAVAGSEGGFQIIALGRLEAAKGFDRLIDAFSLVADAFPEWRVEIFGEGEARADLQQHIDRKGLAERVHLRGNTKCPEVELAKSHIMAFPSRYEGFPNALAEGLAAGLPAVGFADVSGVDELIVDGRTGALVDAKDGIEGFAQALRILMDDAELRARLGKNATEHMRRWSFDSVAEQWQDLLLAAAGGRISKE